MPKTYGTCFRQEPGPRLLNVFVDGLYFTDGPVNAIDVP